MTAKGALLNELRAVKEFRTMGRISRNFRCRWRNHCIDRQRKRYRHYHRFARDGMPESKPTGKPEPAHTWLVELSDNR